MLIILVFQQLKDGLKRWIWPICTTIRDLKKHELEWDNRWEKAAKERRAEIDTIIKNRTPANEAKGEKGWEDYSKLKDKQLDEVASHESFRPEKIDMIKHQLLYNDLLDTDEKNVADEYMDFVMQFGYIVMFSSVFPLAGFFCLLSNQLLMASLLNEFRYKRRNFPEISVGIGKF